MAFVPEDGTGLDDATSFTDVAFADEYHDDRGHERWNKLSVAEKERYLIKATDHIERVFGSRFKGIRETEDQTLSWPRVGAYYPGGWIIDGLPLEVERATSEYAIRICDLGELAPDAPRAVGPQDFADTDASSSQPDNAAQASGSVTYKREKVGPLEEETRYNTMPVTSATGPTSWIPSYPGADLHLRRLLKPGGQTVIR